ncbi:MAG: LacI family transcriptional regulator [Spirochaetes bacterium]|nr:LacI family transcriptional regulator [Spirochaetota bacterium]
MGVLSKNSATILDVARLARCSITTVSRVLNNSSHKVNEETRKRVLEAIRALDYRPNALAKSLLSKRTMTIGAVVPDISNPYYAEVVRGIQDAADQEGYTVLIQNTDRLSDRLKRGIHILREKNVDGFIFTGGLHGMEGIGELLCELKERTVVIGRLGEDLPSVQVDNEQASILAVEHLVQKGYRRIAYVSGALCSTTMVDRLEGFRNALKKFNLQEVPGYIQEGKQTLQSGYEAMRQLLSLPETPEAILFANDQMLFGAMKAISEEGLRVPKDFAVIGFDNVPLCSYFDPTITSIEIPKYELGQAATRLLFSLIRGETPHAPLWFPVQLIERESTAESKLQSVDRQKRKRLPTY